MLPSDREFECFIGFFKTVLYRAERELGSIAFAGEVGEMDMLQGGVVESHYEVATLLVGEVALSAEDPLFVDGRAMTRVDHRGLVISF